MSLHAPVRVLALAYGPYGRCEAEAQATVAVGGTFEEADFAEIDWNSRRADIILNVGGWPIDRAIMETTGCRYVVGYGVGTDYIDLSAASLFGVRVLNMPTANAIDVAVHALTMILACVRRLAESDRSVRAGEFDPTPSIALERTSSLTLGLLAFGNIPRRLAALAAPFQFRMIAHDPHVAPNEMAALGVEPITDLDQFLRRCDILSVHVPSTPATRGMLTRQRLELLPSGCVLVATSRGDIFDTKAVSDLLSARHIAAAGFDVFESEPPDPSNALLASPFTILSPHVAGNSRQSIATMHGLAARFIGEVAGSDSEERPTLSGLTEPEEMS